MFYTRKTTRMTCCRFDTWHGLQAGKLPLLSCSRRTLEISPMSPTDTYIREIIPPMFFFSRERCTVLHFQCRCIIFNNLKLRLLPLFERSCVGVVERQTIRPTFASVHSQTDVGVRACVADVTRYDDDTPLTV